MMDEVLAHLHGSPLAEWLVLRGSLLTQRWIPQRAAHDIDVLVDGHWSPDTLRPHVQQALGDFPGATCQVTVIWAETPFPGLRATLTRGAEVVQVDLGWGERLAVPPVPATVRGRTWRTVTAEVMFGWKVHSLVEHGPRGRWHPKTVADLVLFLRHVPLQPALARRAIELSFESQQLSPTLLQPVLDDATWGSSRGSRGKWKAYLKKAPWVTFTLPEALDEVRRGLRPLLERR